MDAARGLCKMLSMASSEWQLAAPSNASPLSRAGLRFGDRGTHGTRTIMLAELAELLAATTPDAPRTTHAEAVIEQNVLGKATATTRRTTNQRLGELYALDPRVPLFRVVRRVWDVDVPGRPLIALLCALARDPLLRTTAQPVLATPVGAELVRATLLDAMRAAVGARMNPAVLDKVARNAASSWAQSGHLEGRMRKIRRRVAPTPGAVALALWLGALEGLAGEALLRCRWIRVFDVTPGELMAPMLRAKQLGLIHVRFGGDVVEIDAQRLDPAVRPERVAAREQA